MRFNFIVMILLNEFFPTHRFGRFDQGHAFPHDFFGVLGDFIHPFLVMFEGFFHFAEAFRRFHVEIMQSIAL